MSNYIENDIIGERAIISENIKKSFQVFDFTLDMINIPDIYHMLIKILPKNETMFSKFDLETVIACETICASICHKINWDFLRRVIYIKTIKNIRWINPEYIKKIKAKEVEELLSDYDKTNRIRADERSKMLRDLGKSICKNEGNYTNIFFDKNMRMKNYDEMIDFFNRCKVFESDPESKKMQLLFQSLSDYPEFEKLNQYYMPTVDYHLIRCFLRRGIIHPVNQYAKDFIFNGDIERTESTIGALRNVCSDAINNLSVITSLNLKEVNRIEWWIGRTICTEGEPDCFLKSGAALWLKDNFNKCPYYDHCYAINYNKDYLIINEPTYKGNSY